MSDRPFRTSTTSDIRFTLKAQLAHEAFALVGKQWTCGGIWIPFTNDNGRILCPLAMAQGQEWIATQMHELFPWPFGGSKYHPEGVEPEKVAAYYCRPLVALVSPTMNMTVADSYSSRNLLLRFNSFKYGRFAVLTAIERLRCYVRSTLSFEIPVNLPDEGFIRL